MRTEIGVIESATFGIGGYQDCMLVFRFQIGMKGSGVAVLKECGWFHITEEELKKMPGNYKWTHDDRVLSTGKAAWEVAELMRDAKADTLDKLKGKPVEVWFEDLSGSCRGFRILKEAIL